jgi:hypothetical protein
VAYLDYYNLESYLFETVRQRFQQEGKLSAFDADIEQGFGVEAIAEVRAEQPAKDAAVRSTHPLEISTQSHSAPSESPADRS